MSKKKSRWTHYALNALLLVLVLGVMVLVYGLVTGGFFSAPPPADPQREENPAGLVGEIIQVDVRNGCGVAGVAARTTRYLRRHHFDVVEQGNYASFEEDSSFVIDRVGNPAAARKVAAALGLPPSRIRQEIRPDYYLDASVVLGRDYRTLTPFEDDLGRDS